MRTITAVYKSGDNNICMSIDITDEAKTKIQSFLKTKIDFTENRAGLDGVDGDINIQMPRGSESQRWVAGVFEDDLIFVDDEDSYYDFWEYITKIIDDAEPIFVKHENHLKIDDTITEKQEELAEKIADLLNEKLDYRHKMIAMCACSASYTDGSIYMQINYDLTKENADLFISMARDLQD